MGAYICGIICCSKFIEVMISLLSILVVIVSSLLKGLTGFGFALLSLPFLMLWYPAKVVIPVLMICNLIASVFIILQRKSEKLVGGNFRLLIVSGGVFTVVGVLILSYITEDTLIHITGLLIMVLIALSLLNSKPMNVRLPKIVYLLVGAFVGLLTGTISVSGPPLALFIQKVGVSKRQFREIFAWFSTVTALVAIFGYWYVGLITKEVLGMVLIYSPILLVGTLVGKRLNRVLPVTVFRYLNIGISLVSGTMLLLR